jgi:MerR family transcriptional regulator, copper efflux regulator
MPIASTPDPASDEDSLRIGALASLTGVTVEALRYYEKRGLVRPVARRDSGYREYRADSVRVVLFIKRAQALGFSLAEVEELVRLRERAWSGDAPRVLRTAAASKIEGIDGRIRQLNALRDALAKLVSACDAACLVDESACECDQRSPPTATALPCPLVEALDPEELEAERPREPEIATLTASAKLDANNLPATRRRPGARRRSPARETSPDQRRNP